MDRARYHQAERCLQIAKLMSDPCAADFRRAVAARRFAQAIELEKQTPAGGNQAEETKVMTSDDFSDSFYYRAMRNDIGKVLRSRLLPTEPPPERLLDLLHQLDQSPADVAGGTEEPEPPEQKPGDQGSGSPPGDART
jgi:hypothetical protein